MSAREKTRDELDMKTLRELATLPANKTCFDCGQRGPTYVNVTIGSFVCSACGGLLRGLNPPHRVKSLTVCSFTEVEMDRIKSRGNEYCTHIWLGKYDPKTVELDLSSPDKRKEFMVQKYEDKLYYTDPKEAITKMKPRAPAVPVASSVSQSKSHTVMPSRQSSQLQRPGFLSQTFTSEAPKQSSDLFKDFDKDPFVNEKMTGVSGKDASFADFSSAFGSAPVVSIGNQNSNVATNSSVSTTFASAPHKKPAPPPPDRYAALADLDNELHQQVVPDVPVAIPQPTTAIFWSGSASLVAPAAFALGTHNPFDSTTSTWTQQTVIPAVNPFQAMPQGTTTNILTQPNIAKPSLQNGTVPVAYWPAVPGQFQNGQCDVFQTVVDSYNPWAQAFVPAGANPFMNGPLPVTGQAATAPQTNNVKNPFL